MEIRELLQHIDALARINAGPPGTATYIPSHGRATDLRDFATELREMLEHQQGEANTAKAGIDLATVGVIHALEIGLEETHKAHAVVERGRDEARATINAAMARIADEKRSKVAGAILGTCLAQINTIPEVRALNAHDVLVKLAECIANNLAVYVEIPEQCEICGGISQGHTCCPPDEEPIKRGLDTRELMERQGFHGTHDDSDATCEEG